MSPCLFESKEQYCACLRERSSSVSLCLCESREQQCVTVQGDKVSTVQATREMHQRVFPD